MKTKVTFTATIEVAISETWQESAPLSQIITDAERAARVKLDQMPLFNELSLSEIRYARVVLSDEVGP